MFVAVCIVTSAQLARVNIANGNKLVMVFPVYLGTMVIMIFIIRTFDFIAHVQMQRA